MTEEVKTKLKEAFVACIGGAVGGVISYMIFMAFVQVFS